MKKKGLLSSLLVLLTIFSFSFAGKINAPERTTANIISNPTINDTIKTTVFDRLNLEALGLNRIVFERALQGYNQLLESGKLKNISALSIVDFSLPSTAKRLFIVDLNNCKLLFNTYVSHGRNSGLQNASSFSNEPESFKSSLGFYTTESTYTGKHGYSLQLQGLEKGINDNAMSRGIVMHAADYVDEAVVKSQGRLGRSLGCPAIPEKLRNAIIGTISNGSCLFIYANDNSYLKQSSFLQSAKS